MLIVNADDWGRCCEATDNSLACYRRGAISSTSAMVFMEDSVRGAKLAMEAGIDVGLHINFSEEFTGENVPAAVRRDHDRIRRFLRRSKYALLLYNPALAGPFRTVLEAQAEEFSRLFERSPVRMDGHQHMHLCTNMVLQELIPANMKVRRSFSFARGQKSRLNRAYRAWVDSRLAKRHGLTDYFFALSQHLPVNRLAPVLDLARESVVELMTHPQVKGEYDCLMSDEYAQALEGTPRSDYSTVGVAAN